MKMHHVLPALVVAVGLVFASEAPASIIASDSFSTAGGAGTYNSGSLYNQNPTVGLSGFSGAWGNSNTQTTGDMAAQTGGLSHVLVTGGTQAGSVTSAGGTSTRGVYHQLTSVPNSSTYYFSFLMSSAGSRVASLGLRQQGAHDTAASNTSLGGVSVGFSGSNIVAWVNGTATTSIISNYTTNSTYFTLVEILNNGVGNNDTVNIKIYASGNTDLSNPNGSISITNQDVTGKLTHLAAIKGTGTTGVHASLDEFRFGTSLASVVIPEPASLALMGLGGLLMLGRSRKQD